MNADDDSKGGRLDLDGAESKDTGGTLRFDEGDLDIAEKYAYSGEPEGPPPNLRAHLYKWIMGFALAVFLALGISLYMLWGRATETLTTEKVPAQEPPKQEKVAEEPAPPAPKPAPPVKEPAKEPEAEPASKYIILAEEEPEIPPDRAPEPREAPAARVAAEKPGAETEVGPKPSSAEQEVSAAAPPQGDRVAAAKPPEAETPARAVPAKAAKPVARAEAPAAGTGHTQVARNVQPEPRPAGTREKRLAYYVQAGAFREQSNADLRQKLLERDGFPTKIESKDTREGTMYVTWIGPYSSKTRANEALEKVRKQHPGAYLVQTKE